MKKALVVLAVLAISSVGFAQGTVNIFLTNSADGTGLTIPANAFNPTGTMYEGAEIPGFDYSDPVGAGVPYAVTGVPTVGIPTINPGAGEFAYIWVQMDMVTKGKKMQGIHLGWSDAADIAYYIGDDLSGDSGMKRWDGAYTMPGEPEFKMNPQILAGVTGNGLKNTDAAPNNVNLQAYYEQQGGGFTPPAKSIHLLGAIAFADGNYDVTGFLGDLGLSFSGGYQPDEIIVTGATVVPEPASMLLLGLAGLLIRRR